MSHPTHCHPSFERDKRNLLSAHARNGYKCFLPFFSPIWTLPLWYCQIFIKKRSSSSLEKNKRIKKKIQKSIKTHRQESSSSWKIGSIEIVEIGDFVPMAEIGEKWKIKDCILTRRVFLARIFNFSPIFLKYNVKSAKSFANKHHKQQKLHWQLAEKLEETVQEVNCKRKIINLFGFRIFLHFFAPNFQFSLPAQIIWKRWKSPDVFFVLLVLFIRPFSPAIFCFSEWKIRKV